MQIWPAIDIRNGQCVRLAQGDFLRETVYGDSPVKMARHWCEQGAERLHLVDLDGAKSTLGFSGSSLERESGNFSVIREILANVDVPCQVGGGIRTMESIDRFLAAGAQQVVCGTRACIDQDWLEEMANRFPGKIAVGIDARDEIAAVNGWLQSTKQTVWELSERMAKFPLAAIVYTDINRDGLLQGPNLETMERMSKWVSIPVIASGGIASLNDLSELSQRGLSGCIVGRAFYEMRFSIHHANAVAAARLTAEGRNII